MLFFYIRRYVQPEPLSGTLAREAVGCGCGDCDDLDDFLENPHQATKAFPVSKARRHHLHIQLNYTSHSHTTDRSRGGDTLIVKKGLGAKDIKPRDWKKRAKTAQERILSFDQRTLKGLLGPEYSGIVGLRAIKKVETVIDLT